MNKTNYPVDVWNAKKIDKRHIKFIDDTITVSKYQNIANKIEINII